MLERGSPRSRAIALAGSGAGWRASSFRSCSAWVAAGAFGMEPRDCHLYLRHNPARVACGDAARGAVMRACSRRRRSRSGSVRRRATRWSRSRGTARGSSSRRRRSTRSRAAARSSRRSPPTRDPHYGVSTGFGALATLHIPPERRVQLQRSLIRSHAAGSGPEVEREVTRALMLLRLSTLATGRTGVRDRDGAGLRGDAQRGRHAGRPRVRLARLLRRPRAARALRAGADGGGAGARRRRRAARRRGRRSSRSRSTRRRAWR